jgi:hypothetical protein
MATSFISTLRTNTEAYIDSIPNFQKEIGESAGLSFILGSIWNSKAQEGVNCAATAALASTISALTTPIFTSLAEKKPNITQSIFVLREVTAFGGALILSSAALGRAINLKRIALFAAISTVLTLMKSNVDLNKPTSHLFMSI